VAREVTANLHAALRRLCSPNTPQILWADAICINQADKTGKMHQIDLMRDIYTKASKLIMWLGELKQRRMLGHSRR
jgi:hypothetical protein